MTKLSDKTISKDKLGSLLEEKFILTRNYFDQQREIDEKIVECRTILATSISHQNALRAYRKEME